MRVDVTAVSHGYVEAETSLEAVEAVAQLQLAGMDLRATKANATLAKAYEEAGPIQRRRLLAALDGLANPRASKSSRSARRRLARLIRLDQEQREWVRGELSRTPMPAPDGLDDLIRLAEVSHIERNFARMRDWDRQSPVHD